MEIKNSKGIYASGENKCAKRPEQERREMPGDIPLRPEQEPDDLDFNEIPVIDIPWGLEQEQVKWASNAMPIEMPLRLEQEQVDLVSNAIPADLLDILSLDDFFYNFKNNPIDYVYDDNIIKQKSEQMDRIRDEIQKVTLTEEDKTPEALIEFAKGCAKISFESEEEKLFFQNTQPTWILECGDILRNKKFDVNDKLTIEQQATLIKEGFFIEDGKVYQIPEASDDNLLQNKRLEKLISLGEELKKENSLENLMKDFENLYEKNGSPKDLATIIKLVDYQVHISLPAGQQEFPQVLLHKLLDEDDFFNMKAHQLPALSRFEDGGITDDNGFIQEEDGNNWQKRPGILPLDLAVATGIGVCHQNAFLAKYILDELKDKHPEIEYLGSYVTSGSTGVPIQRFYQQEDHFDLMLITQDRREDQKNRNIELTEEVPTELIRYNVLGHNVDLVDVDSLRDSDEQKEVLRKLRSNRPGNDIFKPERNVLTRRENVSKIQLKEENLTFNNIKEFKRRNNIPE